LKDVAQLEGLSLSYLSFFVKKNLNMTFQEYVGSLRFNHAKKLLLLSENKSMFNISIESGFSDPRYLTKAFKAQTGMTPDEYRKQKMLIVKTDTVHRSSHSSEHYYSEREAATMIQNALKQDIA
jgi:AraC-like DNA-binding protein